MVEPVMSRTEAAAGAPAEAGGPLAAYRQLLAQDLLDPDPEQERVAARLDALYEALRAHSPAARVVRLAAGCLASAAGSAGPRARLRGHAGSISWVRSAAANPC